MSQQHINLSEPAGDTVKTTTCYMCACRCGIKVHLANGVVRYIEGNPKHPVNRGVLCAKGSAGIMQHYSPARLTKPLRRVGPRGAGEFVEIEWDEALELATEWLGAVRRDDPRKLAFFTGRDQSQALTGWWAQQYGTPNYAAHGGFCSVNMAAAGMYTIGSSFWEFSEPDWEQTKYFLMFGVAEDHSSNPIKIGLSKLKERGAKFVSVNPVQTGYSAVANEWIGITPGTDGLFVFALIHELLRTGRVDIDYLIRYTDAGFLVVNQPGAPDHGLVVRDAAGEPLCWDRRAVAPQKALGADAAAALKGEFTLPDGRRARPVFQLLAERYLAQEYAPAKVATRIGVSAATIRRIATELATAAFDEEIVLDVPWTDAWGRRHAQTVGRPVSMHAMRGVSAHANGFHTCRAIHVLQLLLGSIDVPGGLRAKAPYPRSLDCLPKPCGEMDPATGRLKGAHLGYPRSPDDLLVDAAGRAQRIDKAYSWEAPLAAHGAMHTVIANAWAGDPYPIDTLFLYMANMAWNSSMATTETISMLSDQAATGEYKIPRIIYSDAYYSETVAFADLVLPDTTYLERWDAISLLDRPISDADTVADAIRQPLLEPDRDVRPFQSVLLDLGARLGLPGMANADGQPTYPGGYPDYIVNHERRPGIGTLAGWRGTDGEARGRGAPNPDQLQRYVDNDCYWQRELPPGARYYRHANREYLEFAQAMDFRAGTEPIVLTLYSEALQRFRLAAEGHGERQPPEVHRQRVQEYFDPLPIWYGESSGTGTDTEDYPLHALTQRPMAMYHSWGGQNAWLRQIHGDNKLYLADALAAELELSDGDWVWVESAHARLKAPIKIMAGLNKHTVWTWNAIGKRRGAWNLSPAASESNKGFLLNHLIPAHLPGGAYSYSNSDPVTGQAAWFDLKVRLRKLEPDESKTIEPDLPAIASPPGLPRPGAELRFNAKHYKP